MNDLKNDILGELENYCRSDYVPMHMPGAKRNADMFYMDNPYALDITEIDGFDNMHDAQGIILNAFQRAAKVFGAEETLFLVNGSSCGIMAAVCGATQKGDTILVARNCHTSVYNAIYLNELEPVYLYPKINSAGICAAIDGKQIRREFECHISGNGKNKIKAVIITSPTYEGMVSDIREIADIVHEYGAVLIVDEAHGAHFNFSEKFPKSAVKCGADAVIQSIHKTLPSFTQTALLHLNGCRLSRERVKMYWNIYQTTSPSYIFMAGIDRCVTMIQRDGDRLFDDYIKRLEKLRLSLGRLKNIFLMPTDDISKLVLLVNSKNGKRLYDDLRERFHIQLEMASLHYVIAMTSIGDKAEYYERFAAALFELDAEYADTGTRYDERNIENIDNRDDERNIENTGNRCDAGYEIFRDCYPRAEVVCSAYAAVNSEKELVPLAASVGKVSAEKICFYPPGVPLVNPGELISDKIIEEIAEGLSCGLEVIGVHMSEGGSAVLVRKTCNSVEMQIKNKSETK